VLTVQPIQDRFPAMGHDVHPVSAT
jgi:hypothetical protein